MSRPPPTPGSPDYTLVPCHSHLTFSTLTNQKRRNFSILTSLPNTQDPSCDALLAADELAAIAIGADPAFMTVSSAETYSGRIVVENIRVRVVLKDGDPEKEEVEISDAKRAGFVQTWNRDATGWQVVDVQGFDGDAGQRKGQPPQTAVLTMLVGSCFRHGWKVTVAIDELCG